MLLCECVCVYVSLSVSLSRCGLCFFCDSWFVRGAPVSFPSLRR